MDVGVLHALQCALDQQLQLVEVTGELDLLELLVNSPYARMFTMNSSIPLTGASAMMLLSIEDGGSITFVSTKS